MTWKLGLLAVAIVAGLLALTPSACCANVCCEVNSDIEETGIAFSRIPTSPEEEGCWIKMTSYGSIEWWQYECEEDCDTCRLKYGAGRICVGSGSPCPIGAVDAHDDLDWGYEGNCVEYMPVILFMTIQGGKKYLMMLCPC